MTRYPGKADLMNLRFTPKEEAFREEKLPSRSPEKVRSSQRLIMIGRDLDNEDHDLGRFVFLKCAA